MKKLEIKKVYQDDAQTDAQHANWSNQVKVSSVAAAITSLICASMPSHAVDLEIYKIPPNSEQSTTLMLMLDLSGSMGPYSGSSYSFSDYGILNNDHCNNNSTTDGNGLTSFTSRRTYHIDSTIKPTYSRNFCYISLANATNQIKGIQSDGSIDLNKGCEPQKDAAGAITGYRCYDRLTRLKDGLYQALQGSADIPKVKDEIIVGLSTFTQSNGVIQVPARPLSEVLGTYQVQVTKTRTVYDEVPVYIDESYEITPAYQRSFWRRKTTNQNNTTYRYQTCGGWSTTTRTCTWGNWGTNTTRPTGFPNPSPGTYSTKACPTGSDYNYNCLEYYQNFPAEIGTRKVQTGTQLVPRIETYTEMETRNTTQRDAILTAVSGFSAGGGTPTPYAYAEAAAYLMGTRTTAPIEWRRIIGNAALDDTGYYTGCNSEGTRVLTGAGTNAGESFTGTWCANWSSGGTPTDVRDPQNYGVFFYVDGNNTRKAYYQLRTTKITKNQVGNSASNNSGYYRCNTAGTTYTTYTGTGVDAGKTLIINSCSSETNTGSAVPTTVTGNSSYKVFNYRWNNTDRKMFYTETTTNLGSPIVSTTDPYSGWDSSVSTVKDIANNKYIAPMSITRQRGFTDDQKKCNGQGIYFLTDGEPTPGGLPQLAANGKNGTDYNLMQSSLGDKADIFDCASSPLGQLGDYYNGNNSGWKCIGKYAQALFDKTKNPTGVKIQTAVVGFGSRFGSTTPTNDIADAQKWGEDSTDAGKYYKGSSAKDVADSINKFVDGLNDKLPSLSTGSSTIPMDALNPEIIQPYAYFPQFEPKVKASDSQQLWFGNVKKYYVVNNGVYSNAEGGAENTVVLRNVLQDLSDKWAKSGVTYSDDTPIYKKGGALSQLLLGTVTTTNDKGVSSTNAGRNVLTDYTFDGTKVANQQISRNFDLTRINYTYTTDETTRTDIASRVKGLMALLGYNIDEATATNGLDLSNVTASLRQMGSIYHSLPVLLTQEGKAVATENATTKKVEISTTGRKDYVMFGTTQGLLSVVDADSGVEKFSFVPKEMIEKQNETFKQNAGSLTGGKEALYYGMDGEWVAHTVYVTKTDGTLTVNSTVRNVIGGTKEDKENLQGKQWVYGGMRMGGRSYYSLDLTDINTPKLKFHIDPSTGKVYSAAYPEGKSFSAIENMGQSWSKPKLDYVNWKGQRKLVMFVGGGYDAGGSDGDGLWVNGVRTGYAGYEGYNYTQQNKRGAGVYMFDANTGDLLWYANSTADTDEENPASTPTGGGTSTVEAIPHITSGDLQYSVVSEIKTVDRNNDGMVDHLYFGDLAGQAFRVDFSRNITKFDSQVTKILNLHQADGTSPRFYLPPVFTAHHSANRKEGANVVVVSFISGNKSAPLLATEDSPSPKKNSTDLQYDGVYAIYDYDIHPDGFFFPNQHIAARTLALARDDNEAVSISQLKYISDAVLARSDSGDVQVKGAIANSDTGWGGWYYRFEKKFSETGLNRINAGASVIKGLSPLIAMEGNLYVTMFDASDNGTSSSCGAGVKGKSFTQRLCLPTGVCAEDANYVYNLGAGIVNLNVGPVSGNTKSIVVPDPADIGKGCVGTACNENQKFITAGGSMRFIPNRWYERYAKAN